MYKFYVLAILKKYLLNLGFKKENISIVSNQLVEITSKEKF